MNRVSITSLAALILMILQTRAFAQTFRDDFNGAELDAGAWLAEPGNGLVALGNGVVTLSCSGQTFPVVTSRQDPFPPGDFRVRVGMQYLVTAHCGNGFGAMDNFWEDYHGVACRPFLIWQDNGGHYVYTGSSGNTWLGPAPDGAYHVYEWTYIGGSYEFFLDGVMRASGACGPRATRVFFGHPHPIGCSPWTSFAIDFIEISAVGATSSNTESWGRVKQVYR